MTYVLIILAGVAAYILFLLGKPETGCRACRGWGTKGHRRRRPCRRCDGTGIRFRLGAPLVHRAAAALHNKRHNHAAKKNGDPDPYAQPRWPRPRR